MSFKTPQISRKVIMSEHPTIHPHITALLEQSDRDGGVDLARLTAGDVVHLETASGRRYTISVDDKDVFFIEGSPKYCPTRRRAYILGSSFGGALLKTNFVGAGLNLEFTTDEHPEPIMTTRITRVIKLQNFGNEGPMKTEFFDSVIRAAV